MVPIKKALELARDADLDQDGEVNLADFAWFTDCYTGAGVTGPVPDDCKR